MSAIQNKFKLFVIAEVPRTDLIADGAASKTIDLATLPVPVSITNTNLAFVLLNVANFDDGSNTSQGLTYSFIDSTHIIFTRNTSSGNNQNVEFTWQLFEYAENALIGHD